MSLRSTHPSPLGGDWYVMDDPNGASPDFHVNVLHLFVEIPKVESRAAVRIMADTMVDWLRKEADRIEELAL
jgi:hypothetical protein